jgi:hypothetical protein
MGDVWALRFAAILAASATIAFVPLAILTGPAHGPFIPVVVAGAGLSVALLIGSERLRKRPPSRKDQADTRGD